MGRKTGLPFLAAQLCYCETVGKLMRRRLLYWAKGEKIYHGKSRTRPRSKGQKLEKWFFVLSESLGAWGNGWQAKIRRCNLPQRESPLAPLPNLPLAEEPALHPGDDGITFAETLSLLANRTLACPRRVMKCLGIGSALLCGRTECAPPIKPPFV